MAKGVFCAQLESAVGARVSAQEACAGLGRKDLGPSSYPSGGPQGLQKLEKGFKSGLGDQVKITISYLPNRAKTKKAY